MSKTPARQLRLFLIFFCVIFLDYNEYEGEGMPPNGFYRQFGSTETYDGNNVATPEGCRLQTDRAF